MQGKRERDQITFNGYGIKLFQVLFNITLQYRRALRPSLELLCTRGITYRWRFPFCLFASTRGRSASLRMLEDLQGFWKTLEIPIVDLPEWYSSFYAIDLCISVTVNNTPKTQWQRGRQSHTQAASTPPCQQDETQNSPAPSPSCRRERHDF